MTICIIPARGGSTRIPGKNTRMFHGKPILHYSIEVARFSGLFDNGQIWVSTDSTAVAEVAYEAKANVVFRPDELARNEVGTQEVMRHALEKLGRDLRERACCLYATAPLLDPVDLKRGYDQLDYKGVRYAMSVGTDPLADAGQFYWGTVGTFVRGEPLIQPRTVMVPMPSNRVCDINTWQDWERAEAMYAKLREEATL